MKTFDELIEISKSFNLNFSLEKIHNNGDFNLKMTNHFHPWSLKEGESKIVYDVITNNNLKCGLEIATGFGISSSVMGQALLNTDGILITVDSYIEEHFNDCNHYNKNTKLVKSTDADGYNIALNLIKSLNLENKVFLEIGWSPDDIPSILNKHLITKKIDFAFIDGGHTFEQVYEDVNVIQNYIGDDCILFFHDAGSVSQKTINLLDKVGFKTYKNYNTPFNLWAYVKGNKFIL